MKGLGGGDDRRSRFVAWRGVDAWRTEAASIELGPDGVRASGTQVGCDPVPYRLDYRLDASDGLLTRSLSVLAVGDGWRRELQLEHDGRGGWRVEARADGDCRLAAPGGDAEALAGALDCDLGASPLTNLMPVRRAGLEGRPGAEEFVMAWVSVPDLAVTASAQRYEHVRRGQGGAVVRYVDRGLFEGFSAELELDADGLVVRYPGLAERVTGGA